MPNLPLHPTDKPLVVIGNGMVSWRFCQKLVEKGVNKERAIIVYGEEPYPAYDRVNLSNYFTLKKASELFLSPPKWYLKNGIHLQTGEKVVRLDPEAKQIETESGQLQDYQDCVLATGSRPFIPPIEGANLTKVFVYRTIHDIEAIREACQGAKRGLVIGGGLLGLEAANVLHQFNIDTTIIQMANTLMDRQLNEDSGGYLLREIALLGFSVRLKTVTEKIEQLEDESLRVSFNQGEPIEVDLVIIATGIRSNDQLAESAGLDLAARGGVMINDDLLTSKENIYALGECASHHGTIYGLVSPGYQMADTLASRLAGNNEFFKGSDQSCRLKLLGVDVCTFGDYMQDGTYHIHRGENVYRSLVMRRGKLVGATAVGPWDQTVLIEQAVREERSFSERQCEQFILTGDLFPPEESQSVLNWPDNTIICNCTRTDCSKLKALVGEGCSEVATLTQKTGAGSVCGSCLPLLAQFVGADADSIILQNKLRGKVLLTASAILGALAVLAFVFMPAFPAAESVQGWYYPFTTIWQNSFWKQVTGFSLAGLSAVALLLSLRKRVRRFNFGNYGLWRAAHSWLGVSTLLVLIFHTGLQFGENLNLWLLSCFLALNFAGALAAIAVTAEKRVEGTLGLRLRTLSANLHLFFFIPYPVLLGFHIAKVYLY